MPVEDRRGMCGLGEPLRMGMTHLQSGDPVVYLDTGIILLLKLKFMLILAPCYILPAQLQGFLSKTKLLSGHTPP